MSLADRIATPDGKRRYVRALFATIADRYDLITVLLSYGQDARWKRRVADLAEPVAGRRALDLATGTGDIAFGLAARGARVVGLDITVRMLQLAVSKDRSRASHFIAGDMLTLPFASAAFEVITTGYGLRNAADLTQAIDEIHRVLAPGGRFVSLDFNRPANAVVRHAYLAYLTGVGGVVGWALHRDPDTYRYIAASLRHYPGAAAVADLLRRRGFSDVRALPALGGLMTIHYGVRA